ncbi:unnamed protein product [Blepharisma stoltei]|uniref:Uncharacterized protein n=1 Tax=Blepharisma stoltei TaxID=1481888 RepID=A0AAU9IEQ8_9CILI|nr:unnamed protein product [Blepharisma stoltei]
MSLKYTETLAKLRSGKRLETWISSESFFKRICRALLPNAKRRHSSKFDLPDPFGPTTAVKFLWNGPISLTPAYDLKFSRTTLSIISLGAVWSPDILYLNLNEIFLKWFLGQIKPTFIIKQVRGLDKSSQYWIKNWLTRKFLSLNFYLWKAFIEEYWGIWRN